MTNEHDGTETQHRVDALTVRLLCEELEQKHNLQETPDGKLIPTIAFLDELSQSLETRGVDHCSNSVAWQLWVKSAEMFDRLKKNTG